MGVVDLGLFTGSSWCFLLGVFVSLFGFGFDLGWIVGCLFIVHAVVGLWCGVSIFGCFLLFLARLKRLFAVVFSGFRLWIRYIAALAGYVVGGLWLLGLGGLWFGILLSRLVIGGLM